MSTKAKTVKKTVKPTLVEKNYRLLEIRPLTFMLKTGRDGRLLIFDEDQQTNRAIRHCPNEKTIFIDKQSDKAVVEPIIFENGLLHTEPQETLTQAFLEAHISNGIKFELIDTASDAEDLISREETIQDIKLAIRNKVREEGGIEALRIVVSVLISDVGAASKMSPAELKYAAYESVDSNPNRFINEDGDVTIFDDSEIMRRAIAQQAFNSGVIESSANGRKVMWSDNKATIVTVPMGKNYLDYFTEFLETEDGLQVVEEIEKRS